MNKKGWRIVIVHSSLLELKAEIAKTDKEIDAMVYALYGLSEDEIGIVEGK